MGTNYYAYPNICKKCNRAEDEIHLLKSSMGWRISIEVAHDGYEGKEPYTDFETFKEYIKREDVTIKDEYEREVSWKEILIMIDAHKNLKEHETLEYGRVVIDGPVDLCLYEFS